MLERRIEFIAAAAIGREGRVLEGMDVRLVEVGDCLGEVLDARGGGGLVSREAAAQAMEDHRAMSQREAHRYGGVGVVVLAFWGAT